jgi:hypothetical protein
MVRCNSSDEFSTPQSLDLLVVEAVLNYGHLHSVPVKRESDFVA